MDLITATKLLVRMLRLDSTSSGSSAETDAKIAIINSMDFNMKLGFWFNKSYFQFSMRNEKFRYNLPSDYVSLIGNPIYNASSVEATSERPLQYRPIDWLLENRLTGDLNDGSINTGTPEFYGIDEITKEILIIPIPFTTGETLQIRYVTDCDIPTYRIVSGVWTFYVRGTDTSLPSDFTNAWLKEALMLVLYKAAHEMLSGPYGGTEEADTAGERYFKLWQLEVNRIRGENSKLASGSAVRRHLK